MRKDVREFIRRLEAVGLTVESTPGHYRVLRDGKPLRKANGMPFTLPFSPDTIRWRRAGDRRTPQARHRSVVRGQKMPKPANLSVTGLRRRHVLTRACSCQAAAAARVALGDWCTSARDGRVDDHRHGWGESPPLIAPTGSHGCCLGHTWAGIAACKAEGTSAAGTACC